MNGREIPFRVGDFAFHRPGEYSERLVVVWMIHQDGRIELIAVNRERFFMNYFETPELLRKPNETEARMIALIWFTLGDWKGDIL